MLKLHWQYISNIRRPRIPLVQLLIFILVSLFFSSCSSDKGTDYQEYMGHWKTDKTKITVRYKLNTEHSQFISDSVVVKIKINDNHTASGFIGLAAFENGKLRKNPGLPWETGVEYIIECGSIGKIYDSDPLEAKEVEIWLGPIDSHGKIKASVRKGNFPMALMLFYKVKD